MSEKLWYTPVVEAVFVKGLGERLTPDIKKAVREEGIDLDKLLPGYPVSQVVRACKRILPLLFPGQPELDAMRELGALSVRGYNETLIGRASVGLLKLIGVRRALTRLHMSMRSGNNYLETRFTPLGPTSAELHFSDVSDIPSFYQGLLEEGGRMVGAKDMRVSVGEVKDGGYAYHVEWVE